jgi:23S rRNA-intervening sequence protein
MEDLPIIQKTYDLIKWYVPIINRMPRNHRFTLGERIISELYTLLDELIRARYSREKLPLLQASNTRLDILRYQTRLLFDFNLIKVKRYEYINQRINEIGTDLGGWLRHQTQRPTLSSSS